MRVSDTVEPDRRKQTWEPERALEDRHLQETPSRCVSGDWKPRTQRRVRVIQWRAAGYDSVIVSLLWSEAVLAEVPLARRKARSCTFSCSLCGCRLPPLGRYGDHDSVARTG
jgi:hypothetical protein